METLIDLKKRVIDNIVSSNDEELLKSVALLLEDESSNSVAQLTPEQTEMLVMSEQDIIHGRLVSNEDVKENDSIWMKF